MAKPRLVATGQCGHSYTNCVQRMENSKVSALASVSRTDEARSTALRLAAAEEFMETRFGIDNCGCADGQTHNSRKSEQFLISTDAIGRNLSSHRIIRSSCQGQHAV